MSYEAHSALAVGLVEAGVSPTRISNHLKRSGELSLNESLRGSAKALNAAGADTQSCC